MIKKNFGWLGTVVLQAKASGNCGHILFIFLLDKRGSQLEISGVGRTERTGRPRSIGC